MTQQSFINTDTEQWLEFGLVPGTQFIPLAEPVPQGSIHKLHIPVGTIIPVHFHPCDEYVYVLHGTIETGGRECKTGTFWFAPANTKNGSHRAITSVEILTIRLGQMGVFGQAHP